MGALNLLIILWLFVIALQARRWRRRYHLLLGEAQPQSLEERLVEYRRLTEQALAQVGVLQARTSELEQRLPSFIRRVGVVRFNAFPEVGSDLSFAVALLNDLSDGVVISSIYGREESRTFAKPIQGGKSSYRLTPEEERAITLATSGEGIAAGR
ncbi:hypothetical protein SY88_07715 [Clostridiales bacterium PH28_bin88]|nr:hypothetical protein SY88_07715 [Clostridiales bacterium PH28_bin88]